MNGDETKYLNEKFVELNTRFDERWKAHDLRSKELRTDMDSKLVKMERSITGIYRKLNELLETLLKKPCKVHEEKMKGLSGQIKRVWAFIVMIICSFVGGFFWMLRIK